MKCWDVKGKWDELLTSPYNYMEWGGGGRVSAKYARMEPYWMVEHTNGTILDATILDATQ